MAKHPFLSTEWIEQCRKLREGFRSQINNPGTTLRLNLIVENVPFGDSVVNAHLDTSQGEPEIDLGHLSDADAAVTADYDLVKSIIIDTNMGAAMEAMQLGRIRIDGDMFKLMGLASLNADAGSIALFKAIRDITE